MWEHAPPLIGIPGAVKAAWDLLDRVKITNPSTKPEADQTQEKLASITVALSDFAQDAIELKAYKSLHALTNAFPIDLRDSFQVGANDVAFAEEWHLSKRVNIMNEFTGLSQARHAGALLQSLIEDQDQMAYLRDMPSTISSRIKFSADTKSRLKLKIKKTDTVTWDQYYYLVIEDSKDNYKNFDIFSRNMSDLSNFNSALNNHADGKIQKGIDAFNKLMSDLRHACKPG